MNMKLLKTIKDALKAKAAKLLTRVQREPVLVVAVVISLGNLVGQDLTEYADLIESAVVIAGGVLARHFVTPTHDPRLPADE